MSLLNKLLAAIAVCVAILAATILREPAPDGATNPYKMKAVNFMSRVLFDYRPRILAVLGYTDDIEIIRNAANRKAPWQAPGVKTEDRVLEGVPVRIYYPPDQQSDDASSGLLPGIVYYHGGGWVVCSIDTYIHVCSRLSHDTRSIVIVIDYQMAPEVKYHEILEQNVKVTKLILEKSQDFGIDPQRIAIAGDSAGGHLALGVSMKLRDIGVHPQPKLMVAIYPITQTLDLDLPSYQQNAEGPVLLKSLMAWFISYVLVGNNTLTNVIMRNGHVPRDVRNKMAATYINHDNIPSYLRYPPYQPISHVGDDVVGDLSVWEEIKDLVLDPYFSPLLAEDLSGLPETVLYTGKYDVLRDEGILMVQRLREAGVAVHHIYDPLGFHGTWSSFRLYRDAEDTVVKIMESIKERL